jgi:hypothetical protein
MNSHDLQYISFFSFPMTWISFSSFPFALIFLFSCAHAFDFVVSPPTACGAQRFTWVGKCYGHRSAALVEPDDIATLGGLKKQEQY